MNTLINPQPETAGDYPLTEEQIAEYRQNGHILLRGVCSPEEVIAYRDTIREVMARRFPAPPPMEERDIFSRAFLSLSNTWNDEPTTTPFIFARRFAKICADLMGADAVRIFHNQVFFKEPGGGPTPWHQDHYYWPLDTEKMCTIWMPLVDITPEMGALSFATGSHRLPFLDEMGIAEGGQEHFDRIVAEKGLPFVTDAMQAGDATVHAGWTLHTALGNGGTYTREVSAISYFDDGARVLPEEKMNRARLSDLAVCVPGATFGDIAASSMNPLVFKREKGEER
jgi:ectoine hydroxylase-related dioxygenase (phytanoyl-CoA dioxygenase family)